MGRGRYVNILGLVLTLAAVGAFLAWTYGGSAGGGGREDAVTTEEGGPPANVTRDPRAARDYAVGQGCLASCTSTDRICRGTVDSPEATERCARQLADCQRACRP